jgi:ABC-type multidrug transport system fused ATPase/permease subunit
VLGALRVVKAFGQEESESKRFTARSDKAVVGHMQMARLGKEAISQFMQAFAG